MKKKRYVFCNEGNLIIRSIWSNTAVRVTSNAEDIFTAERLSSYELEEEISKAEPKEPSKKEIIFSMIAFYTMIAITCVRFGESKAGIIATLYLIGISSVPLYFLLTDIMYSIKNKELAQYTYILKKIESCHSQQKEINAENLNSVINTEKIHLTNIRIVLLSFAMTPCILMIQQTNITMIMPIEIIITIIYCMSFRNQKMIKSLTRLNNLLIYRKPNEEQVEMVIFGIKALIEYETGSFYHF